MTPETPHHALPASPKGRPRKTEQAKGPYKKILVDSAVRRSLLANFDYLEKNSASSIHQTDPALMNQNESYLTTEELMAGNSLKTAKIKAILNDTQATKIYWNLVFSVSYEALCRQLSAVTSPGLPTTSTRPNLKGIATLSGINYTNLKTMFQGNGYATNTLKYLIFLKKYHISFDAISYNTRLVESAYNRLLVGRLGQATNKRKARAN